MNNFIGFSNDRFVSIPVCRELNNALMFFGPLPCLSIDDYTFARVIEATAHRWKQDADGLSLKRLRERKRFLRLMDVATSRPGRATIGLDVVKEAASIRLEWDGAVVGIAKDRLATTIVDALVENQIIAVDNRLSQIFQEDLLRKMNAALKE